MPEEIEYIAMTKVFMTFSRCYNTRWLKYLCHGNVYIEMITLFPRKLLPSSSRHSSQVFFFAFFLIYSSYSCPSFSLLFNFTFNNSGLGTVISSSPIDLSLFFFFFFFGIYTVHFVSELGRTFPCQISYRHHHYLFISRGEGKVRRIIRVRIILNDSSLLLIMLLSSF